MDKDEPKCKKSNTEAAEPNRANERIERLLPKCVASKTDKFDPKRHMPIMEHADPSLE